MARETVENGQVRFEVAASLPFLGRLIRYAGRLDRVAEERER
jgi:hypothetical protein